MRRFLSWELNEYSLYPTSYKDEEEKKEKSHYIYCCTKKEDWREVYQANFEPAIVKLILAEKKISLPSAVDSENDDDQVNVLGE